VVFKLTGLNASGAFASCNNIPGFVTRTQASAREFRRAAFVEAGEFQTHRKLMYLFRDIIILVYIPLPFVMTILTNVYKITSHDISGGFIRVIFKCMSRNMLLVISL